MSHMTTVVPFQFQMDQSMWFGMLKSELTACQIWKFVLLRTMEKMHSNVLVENQVYLFPYQIIDEIEQNSN